MSNSRTKGVFCLEGACKKRIIHFGSCGTLDIHGNRVRSFLQRTGALAVCGYKSEVDWMLSAAFEIIPSSPTQTALAPCGALRRAS